MPKRPHTSDETYYDIETILKVRIREGREECLIRWLNFGPDKDSWEPVEFLSKGARKLLARMKQENNEEENSEDEKEDEADATIDTKADAKPKAAQSMTSRETIEIPDDSDEDDDSVVELYTISSPQAASIRSSEPDAAHAHQSSSAMPPDPLESIMTMKEIQRIPVDHPEAKELVTGARLAGVPVIITGHLGWAQFAAGWLKDCPTNELLDLSRNYTLDAERMKRDLGQAQVPVLSPDYDAHHPISKYMTLAQYLDHHWNDKPSAKPSSFSRRHHCNDAPLYLHQWQFPVDPMIAPKLCGRHHNNPLPVLGDDLLCYWNDDPHMQGDNPLQYLFMGPAQTMSKLHRDTGGLLITIAPIVGTKEVQLVHRDDAEKCLGNLEADLDHPDLNKFPLMPAARVYKTVLVPGEILIMPQSTYHQCRNLTPCLSYSRFFLDTDNLLPFFDSFVAQDAVEIDHDQVLWNAMVELQGQLRSHLRERKPNKDCPKMARLVKELGLLRQYGQAMYLHYVREEDDEFAIKWTVHIQKTDQLLHRYRFRDDIGSVPAFQHLVTPMSTTRRRSASSAARQVMSTGRQHCFVGELIHRLPMIPAHLQHVSADNSVSLQEGDRVRTRLHGRMANADILSKRKIMEAALVHYDDYDSLEDEWQPISQLRVSIPGSSSTTASFQRLSIGAAVCVNERGVQYKAKILTLKSCSFYLLALRLGQTKCEDEDKRPITQWHPRDSMIEKVSR